jgi:hypothetical protein
MSEAVAVIQPVAALVGALGLLVLVLGLFVTADGH